jgi:hypothetical protein
MTSTKRYQIFVSSTHTDLRIEREAVINELTKIGYIAVGMEQFPATDEEQMEFIRPIIDESDYYIVIVKGRYGSVASDGTSYTEKEFRYAQDKGIPLLAFLYHDPSELQVRDTDDDPTKMEKLKAFRNELESKRIVKYWSTAAQLIADIKDSVNNIVRRKPAVGWIRGDQALDPLIYKELELIRKENESLRKQLESAGSEISFPEDIADLDDSITISYEVYQPINKDKSFIKGELRIGSIRITWRKLIDILTEELYKEETESRIGLTIKMFIVDDQSIDQNNSISGRTVIEFDNSFIKKLRFQLEALGIITCIPTTNTYTTDMYWTLTEKGKRYIAKRNAVPRLATMQFTAAEDSSASPPSA